MVYYLIWLSLVYQASFIYLYGSDKLVKFNSTIAEIYWATSGLCGIILGLFAIIFNKRLTDSTKNLSIITFIIGMILIILDYMSYYITSM